ncbi:RNA 2',3'-cyclic phosphodiesterase [Planctomycetota bacterium]|nr:RNA 2',3'-cyclic phosphodiesterase [Planctomycetota bacterium]
MVRLFIAIPIELSEAGMAVYEDLEALGDLVRVPSTENLHLTLRFIGEVPNTFVEPIADTLTELHEEYNFESRLMELRGVSRFPSSRKKPARVVFLTLDEDSEHFIIDVSEKITAALEEMSPSIDRLDRNVVPHLTLARVKDQEKAANNIEKIMKKYEGQALGHVKADRIELIASTLTGGGAFYTTQHELELALPGDMGLDEA